MAEDFEVRGAEDFYRAARAIKAAGGPEARKEMTAAIRKIGAPLIQKSRAAAEQKLPKRGGLAAQVAKEPQRVQVRTGQDTAGVRIVVGKRRGGARGADAGLIRHPVFAKEGETRTWVNQSVPSGWFTETMQSQAPTLARPAIEAAMSTILEKVVRGAR